MLQGSLRDSQYVFDPEFLKAYGLLLDSLGDRFEAGKFLFLSGIQPSSGQESIDFFRSRTKHLHIKNTLSLFPKSIRKHGLGRLPQNVRNELQELGADLFELKRLEPHSSPASRQSNDTLLIAAVFGFLIVMVLCALLGIVTIYRWDF